MQAEYLVVNIIEPYVIGSIVSGVTGCRSLWGLPSGAPDCDVHSDRGLKGTAIANVVHCSVIILGLLLVGTIAMNNLGGWEAVTTLADGMLADANKEQSSWWSFTGIGWATIIASLSLRRFILRLRRVRQLRKFGRKAGLPDSRFFLAESLLP